MAAFKLPQKGGEIPMCTVNNNQEVRMEHNPNTCPNKQLIDGLRLDFSGLGGKFAELDKQIAVDNAVLKTQYSTIIDMLTSQGKTTDGLAKRIGQYEKDFAVNDYKTNQATTFIDRVTWGLVAKIGAILGIFGLIVSTVVSALKG